MMRALVFGVLAAVSLVGGTGTAAADDGAINITAADVRDREVESMREEKERLAVTARELRRQAEAVPGTVNTRAYAEAYESFQEQLRRARNRVWWKKTGAVAIPEVPRPGSAAYAALEQARDDAEERRAAELRRARDVRTARQLESAQLATQQAVLAEERRQSELLESRLTDDYSDRGYYLPYYRGRIHPGPVYSRGHHPGGKPGFPARRTPGHLTSPETGYDLRGPAAFR